MKYKNNLEELGKKGFAGPPKPNKIQPVINDTFDKDVNEFMSASRENNRHNNNLNAYALLDSNGKAEISSNVSAACYARISIMVNNNHDTAIVMLNGKVLGGRDWYGDGLNKTEYIDWLDYLANDSAYSDAFIGKDAKRMFNEKVAYFHTDLPANLVVGAMTQLRQAWEYTDIVKGFCFFHKMLPEVSPDFCMYLGHIFVVNAKVGTISYNPTGGGHIPLYPRYMGKTEVLNLINHKIIKKNGLLINGAAYRGVNALWGEDSKAPFQNTIRNALAGVKKIAPRNRLFSANKNFLYTPSNNSGNYGIIKSLSLINDIYQDELT